MKYLTFLFVLSFFVLSSCGDDDPVEENENPLIGTWKLVESFISPGGPGEWREIEDGFEVSFDENGNYNNFNQCISGSYTIQGDTLTVDCKESNSIVELDFSYIMVFNGDNLDLTNPFCIEPCIDRYERIE